MAVPDFQSMLLPFLQIIADGNEHAIKQITASIADVMGLSRDDREEMLPSGNQRRLANRVGWARTHLKNALLIHYTGRGVMKITPRGLEAIASNSGGLTLKDLDRFPEHYEWRNKKRPDDRDGGADPSPEVDKLTPDERIATLARELNIQLADELLSKVREMDPYKFEQLVIDLLFAMGYGGSRAEAANVTKASNDEGIDGIISEDRLGLDMIYVQAKRWREGVGRKEIQAFVGALAGKQASKGVFIKSLRPGRIKKNEGGALMTSLTTRCRKSGCCFRLKSRVGWISDGLQRSFPGSRLGTNCLRGSRLLILERQAGACGALGPQAGAWEPDNLVTSSRCRRR